MVTVEEQRQLLEEELERRRVAAGGLVEVAPGLRVSPGLIDPETGAVKRFVRAKKPSGKFSTEAISAREAAARESSRQALLKFQAEESKRKAVERAKIDSKLASERQRIRLEREARLKLARTQEDRKKAINIASRELTIASLERERSLEKKGVSRFLTAQERAEKRRGVRPGVTITKKSDIEKREEAREALKKELGREPSPQRKEVVQQKVDIEEGRRKISFDDIAFKESFVGDKIPEGKISPAGFIDIKVERGAVKLSDIILEKVPEGRIKTFLERPSPVQLIPSELLKFGFFAPAFATTVETLGGISSQVAKTASTETRFVADVKPLGKGKFDVDVLAKTTIEDFDKTLITISRQRVQQTGGRTIIGTGKGLRIGTTPGAKPPKTEFFEFDIVGGAKTIGRARKIRPIADQPVKIEQVVRSVGSGVEARAFAQDTSRIVQRAGLRMGVREFDKELLPVLRVLPDRRGVRFERIGVTRQDLTGAIQRIPETDFLLFKGQTARPTTTISPRGISRRLEDINVRGLIRESQEIKPSVIDIKIRDLIKRTEVGVRDLTPLQELQSIIKRTTPKTQTIAQESQQAIQQSIQQQTPKQLTKGVEESVSQQVAGQIANVRSALQQQTSQKISPKLSNVVRQSSLLKQRTRQIQPTKQKQAQPLLTRQKTMQDILQQEILRSSQAVKQDTTLKTKTLQKQILKISPIFKTPTITRGRITRLPSGRPRPRRALPVFPLLFIPKFKPLDIPTIPKKKKKGREDVGISETFLQRQLVLDIPQIRKIKLPTI